MHTSKSTKLTYNRSSNDDSSGERQELLLYQDPSAEMTVFKTLSMRKMEAKYFGMGENVLG